MEKQLKNKTEEMDFNSLFEQQDSEEQQKKDKFLKAKQGKQVQLLAKIQDLHIRIGDAEINLRKSLVDPMQDSVAWQLKINQLKEESKIATEFYQKLFGEIGKSFLSA